MQHSLMSVVVISSLALSACDDLSHSPRQGGSPNQAASIAPAIPADVSFTVTESHTVPGIKRSLDVRLNRKVSEETLQAIALKLRAIDPRNYERTFITYYLPDMAIGSGAWATTHFNPDLEVRVLGLTAEAEKSLSDK